MVNLGIGFDCASQVRICTNILMLHFIVEFCCINFYFATRHIDRLAQACPVIKNNIRAIISKRVIHLIESWFMNYKTDISNASADFHLFKRRGRKISGGVQTTPLSELQQGLGVWVKAFHTK
jgi:hypothetical protein